MKLLEVIVSFALTFKTTFAALPNDVTACIPPASNMPNYMSISEQIEASEYTFYAKVLDKTNVTTNRAGQSYTVVWSQECSHAIKQPGRYVTPQTFSMPDMGTFPYTDFVPCGPRNVIGGFNYIFFAKAGEFFGDYILDEVNNQTGVYRLTDENKVELAPYLYDCLSHDNCHEDDDTPTDEWVPMLLSDRIKAAEYAFEVHMTDETTGCVQCVLNQPADPSKIEHIFAVNETIEYVNHHATCLEYDIKPETRYIMLLETVESTGTIDVNNQLSADEVNGQHAIYELTSEIQAELADMLSSCPAVDYQCPADPSPPKPDDPTQAPPTQGPTGAPTDAPTEETTAAPGSDLRSTMSYILVLSAFGLFTLH